VPLPGRAELRRLKDIQRDRNCQPPGVSIANMGSMPSLEGPALRETVLSAATELLVKGGRDAVSTRAVCLSAGIQSPTIYRLFGDKQGLLDAIADRGFRQYLSSGGFEAPGPHPLVDLQRWWDLHAEFGLAHPYLYSLAYGDARPGTITPAARKSQELLETLIHRIAVVGVLAVSEERAVWMVTASICGTVFVLISMPQNARDLTLSATARDASIVAITNATPVGARRTPTSAVIQLRASLDDIGQALSDNERALMRDWLDRLLSGAAPPRT